MATLTPQQTKSISQQISQIQSGINTLSAAKSAGMTITPTTTTEQAQAYISQPRGGAVVGGRIVGAGGVDLGAANPADLPGAGSPKRSFPAQEPTTPQVDTPLPKPTPMTPQPAQTTSAGTIVAGTKGVAGSGVSGDTYRQAVNLAKQAGVSSPADPGTGMAGVSTFLGNIPAPAGPSYADTLVQTDPFFEQIRQVWDDFLQPQNQRKSLVDTYKQMVKDSGIESIDTELINTKKVIEGTEDDIRTEITKAGGFATESQVLAMTFSRNKQLIKNYNTLLETRNAKEKHLETLIGLETQDRAEADRAFDRKMNFAFQVADYQNKMKQNALNLYEKMGWDSVFNQTGGDPYYVSLVEKTAGMPRGSLSGLAVRAAEDRRLAVKEKELGIKVKESQLLTDVAQRGKLAAETEKARAETPGSPEMREKEKKAIEQQVNNASVVLNKVAEARKLANNAGLFAPLASKIGGTGASNLKAKLDTIAANLSFSELQKMREASKTGGALGSVSERELELLGATVASLSINQSPKQLKESLANIETHYTNVLGQMGYSVAPDGSVIKIIE